MLVIHILILLAFFSTLIFTGVESFLFLRGEMIKKRYWMWLAFIGVCIMVFYGLEKVPPRGGYNNDHDFNYMSADFFDLKNREGVLFASREVTPLAMMALMDRLAGYSLGKFLNVQNGLWAAVCFLIIFLIRKAGGGGPLAFVTALFFGLNFLTLSHANAFATALTHVFYLLSALCAIFCFWRKPGWLLGIWVFAAALLVAGARVEFVPVVLGAFLTGWAWRKFPGTKFQQYAAAAFLSAVFGIWR